MQGAQISNLAFQVSDLVFRNVISKILKSAAQTRNAINAKHLPILKNQTMYFRLSVQASIFPSAPAKCHVRSQAVCLSRSFPE